MPTRDRLDSHVRLMRDRGDILFLKQHLRELRRRGLEPGTFDSGNLVVARFLPVDRPSVGLYPAADRRSSPQTNAMGWRGFNGRRDARAVGFRSSGRVKDRGDSTKYRSRAFQESNVGFLDLVFAGILMVLIFPGLFSVLSDTFSS